MNFVFKWRHRDGSTVQFSRDGWSADDPEKAILLSKLNGLSGVASSITPEGRDWLARECELIEFSGVVEPFSLDNSTENSWDDSREI
jgi:hypothetical protein